MKIAIKTLVETVQIYAENARRHLAETKSLNNILNDLETNRKTDRKRCKVATSTESRDFCTPKRPVKP